MSDIRKAAEAVDATIFDACGQHFGVEGLQSILEEHWPPCLTKDYESGLLVTINRSLPKPHRDAIAAVLEAYEDGQHLPVSASVFDEEEFWEWRREQDEELGAALESKSMLDVLRNLSRTTSFAEIARAYVEARK